MRGTWGKVFQRSARSRPLCVAAAAALGCAIYSGAATLPAEVSAQTVQSDGSIKLAGRTVRCGTIRTIIDPRLPSEGAAAPGRALVLNPRLLRQHPATVQLFVFHHECGHHWVGASELDADCWGVEQGVRQGWLDQRGLREVCRSFDGAPETESHPSGQRRCRNIDRCYASAMKGLEQPRPAVGQAYAGSPPPKLVDGPRLAWSSKPSAASTKPGNPSTAAKCDEPSVSDVIGRLVDKIMGTEMPRTCP